MTRTHAAGSGRTAVAKVVAAAVAVVLAASGCSSGPTDSIDLGDARPVSAEESQALAMTRVRNLEAGTRSVAFELEDEGAHYDFEGWFDYSTRVGYGRLTKDEQHELIFWNHTSLAAKAANGDTPPPPSVDSLDAEWGAGPLDAEHSRVHAALAVVAALGSDRPENPLLLSGSGALWLGERSRSGQELMVIAGPPSEQALPPGEVPDPEKATTRYWIEDTGLAHWVDIRLGAGAEWTQVEFGAAQDVTVGDPFAPQEARDE